MRKTVGQNQDEMNECLLVMACGNEFARILRDQWLSPEQFAEMRKRNAAERDSRICHSHDYCDANMAMDAAFRKVFRRSIDYSEADVKRWNEAWEFAKQKHLK